MLAFKRALADDRWSEPFDESDYSGHRSLLAGMSRRVAFGPSEADLNSSTYSAHRKQHEREHDIERRPLASMSGSNTRGCNPGSSIALTPLTDCCLKYFPLVVIVRNFNAPVTASQTSLTCCKAHDRTAGESLTSSSTDSATSHASALHFITVCYDNSLYRPCLFCRIVLVMSLDNSSESLSLSDNSVENIMTFPPCQLTDFVLHYDNTALHVHKLVLHHHSAYFRTYFETLSAPSCSSDSCHHAHIAHCIHLPSQTTLVEEQP